MKVKRRKTDKIIDIAQNYLERGWAVIPVTHRSKRPILTKWQHLRLRRADLRRHFSKPCNIGVLLGEPSGWLVDVDLDHLEAIKLAHKYLPRTRAIFGRESKPRSHWLYRVEQRVETKKFQTNKRTMIAELRSTGTQTVFPGSVHECGEFIGWEEDDAPANVDPDELLAAMGLLVDAVAKKIGETIGRDRLEGTRARKVGDRIRRGARNDALTRLAGAMRRQGADAASIKRALLSENHRRCQPPLERAEVACIARSVSRYDPKAREPSQAERLVQLALELYRIGRTEAGEPFAVARNGPNIALMLRGSRDALRSALAREYRRRSDTTPSASALGDAMTALQGESLEATLEPVHLRTAEHRGGVVIDLGRTDGKAVLVKPHAWEVLDHSPVLFRRTALTGELPVPERGGNLHLLRELMNVTDESWSILRGFMVAALIPGIPHPIAMMGGQQGVGKSTGARYIIGVIDPSSAPLKDQPRDPEAWAMMASGSWAVAVDNVGYLPPWLQDALCRAVTGDGWVRRALYTDSDLAVLAFRRVVILTSIDAGALRGDLGDRILLVDLEAIPETRRRGEVELDRMFSERRPLIFGALLDLLAAVLAELPSVKLVAMPRMADFARVLGALDAAQGDDSDGSTLASYLAQGQRVAGEVVDSDAVALAIVQMTRKTDIWKGTSGQLLEKITLGKPPAGWPTTARAMIGRLQRVIPALVANGVRVTIPQQRTGRGRIITIEKCRNRPSPPSQYSQVIRASDDCDGRLRQSSAPRGGRRSRVKTPGKRLKVRRTHMTRSETE